jgi:Sec7-like guanine-nucleotide exchange factor
VSVQLAEDSAAIAKFLLSTPRLDDAALGDYVGDGDELCSQVLKCYVSSFDFQGLGFDDALRKFLSAFRLPGEAQKIERMEVLIADPEFLEEYSTEYKNDAIDFLRENMNSIKNLSLRTLIATTKIRAEGGAWKNLAKFRVHLGGCLLLHAGRCCHN